MLGILIVVLVAVRAKRLRTVLIVSVVLPVIIRIINISVDPYLAGEALAGLVITVPIYVLVGWLTYNHYSKKRKPMSEDANDNNEPFFTFNKRKEGL